MSLQFIYGPVSADKKKRYISILAPILAENSEASAFVVVPEDAKFEGEVKVLEELWKTKEKMGTFIASTQLQVFSFSRLAWYFLRDEPIYQMKTISDAGISMVLRKLLSEHEQEFQLFRREIHQEGFILQLTQLMKEFKAGRVDASDIQRESMEDDTDTTKKMDELALIYQYFTEAMDGDFLHYELLLEKLAQTIYQKDLSQTHIVIEGFNNFSAQEFGIIQACLSQAASVRIVLNLDRAYVQSAPRNEDLFFSAGQTYHQLYQFARMQGVPILQDIAVHEPIEGYHPFMFQLERYWVDSQYGIKKSNQSSSLSNAKENFQVWACDSKYAEVKHVTQEIKRLVVEEGYRFKDFQLLARNVEEYETLVRPLFRQAGVRVFYDKAEAMSHHPFFDFLDSLFRVRRNYWRYPDVMRFLRTELLAPPSLFDGSCSFEEYRSIIDQTENILLAYGLEGNAWFQRDAWRPLQYDSESLVPEQVKASFEAANMMKDLLQAHVVPFYQSLRKAQTGTEAATTLYTFLEKAGVNRQILSWRDEAIEVGELERARQHEQVWKTFTNLLDEYVETMGAMPFDERIFHEILVTGFETATYRIVPPTLDEVIFSNLEGARLAPRKIVILLGATMENLPKVRENRTLLTNEEREQFSSQLEETDKYLRPSIAETTAAEPMIAYQAFLSGKERLIVTYPRQQDDTNRSTRLSPYISRLVDYFGIDVVQKRATIVDSQNPESFVGTKLQNIGHLVFLLRDQMTSKQPMPILWRRILTYLVNDSSVRAEMKHIFMSLNHKNVPVQLTPELAAELYGADLFLSVSQLERYYEDPYSHFLLYGLRLRERQKYELSSAATGEFYHEALETLLDEMNLRNHSKQEVEAAVHRILQTLFGSDKYGILSTSNRMAFMKEQLTDTLVQFSTVMNEQAQRTPFVNIQTEAVFGMPGAKNPLDGLVFPLRNGRSLSVRGKIDRIDVVNDDSKKLLTIMDYKSSKHSFRFEDAYYGLAMQMITYLDVAMQNANRMALDPVLPAGAFYLHVKNPFLESVHPASSVEALEQLLNANRWRGLLVTDHNIPSILDPQVEAGESSLILPFGFAKSGDVRKSKTDLLTMDELDLLIKNNRRRIRDAGNEILSGKLKMNPVKDRSFIPTVQGPYRSISQFDATLPENRYRKLEKLERDDLFKRLREELAEEEEDTNDRTDSTPTTK